MLLITVVKLNKNVDVNKIIFKNAFDSVEKNFIKEGLKMNNLNIAYAAFAS